MALFNSMSLRGRITLAGCAIAFLAAVAIIFKMSTAPSYVTVMSGIDATKGSEITAALSAAGVSGHLAGGGTQLEVPKGQEDRAITALAQQGLNTTHAQLGFAQTLDKQKLGASSQQQKIAYQRGLEGEIAGALTKIEGVGTPNVRLTIPDQTAFVGAEDQAGATAAVVLGSEASSLAPGAVRGIANIVASSVPNLKSQMVTITDGTGALLWPAGDGGSGDASSNKAAAEAARAQATEAKLNGFLDSTVGPGKARVKVNYDLNMDKVSQEKLAYDKAGTPTHAEEADETLKGTGSVPGGTSGVASNVPSYSGSTGSAGGTNNYKQASKKTDFGVGKTITKTDVATGAIKKMQVGLVLDSGLKLARPEQDSLQAMVAQAAGVDSSRGDTISTTTMAFAKVDAAKTSPVPAGMMGALKGIGIGIATLLFLFFLSRYLGRRETDELMDEPSWLRQLPRPPEPQIVTQELQMAGAQAGFTLGSATDPRRAALEQLADNEPDRVAAHLRSWITEDGA